MTKPTGRPRGRPRKSAPRAPLAPHRPKQVLASDTDRFALALIVGFMTRGRSAKDASEIVAFGQRGEIVDLAWVSELGLTPKELAKMRPRWRTEMVAEVNIRKGSTTSIRNHGRALIMKLERYLGDPSTHRWLVGMAAALLIMCEERDLSVKANLLADIPGVDNMLAGRVSLYAARFSVPSFRDISR
jgi:hypothetical protein